MISLNVSKKDCSKKNYVIIIAIMIEYVLLYYLKKLKMR
ncbi:Uncharacterised protein [Elizabethkingia anophelis]|uniref:Uncharacterized protein n=1 Tax=Elizabethkingia anophelis TaxID=1117645 RepID=A0A7Z7M0J7_9FLAO|nr:Uncharacterised protein [Elizabethkingia anophelis]